jgi:ubiquitin-conjugating enzyme E2 S
LLIYPNPESALNEEAGRFLLEKYEDYFKHAKLMTSIHAKHILPFQQDESFTEPKMTTEKTMEKKRGLRRL